jgi:hypothetical protein
VDPEGKAAGLRSKDPATLQDIVPTVKRMALGEAEQASSLGRDLWTPLLRGETPPERPIFSERPHYDRERIRWRSGRKDPDRLEYGFMTSVILGRYKLIREPDGECRLYDILEDPSENVDIGEKESAVRDRLRKILEAWMQRNETGLPGEGVEISEERRANLRALGYIK